MAADLSSMIADLSSMIIVEIFFLSKCNLSGPRIDITP